VSFEFTLFQGCKRRGRGEGAYLNSPGARRSKPAAAKAEEGSIFERTGEEEVQREVEG